MDLNILAMSTEKEPDAYMATEKTSSPTGMNSRRQFCESHSPVEKILQKIDDPMQVLSIVENVDLNDLVYPETLFLCYLCVRSGQEKIVNAFLDLIRYHGSAPELTEITSRYDVSVIARRELQDAPKFLEFYNSLFTEAIKARKVDIAELLVIDSYELLLNYKVDDEMVKQLLKELGNANESRFQILNLLFQAEVTIESMGSAGD